MSLFSFPFGFQSKLFSVILVVLSISGCNIHPLPKDVTISKVDTFAIVKNIRCEAKFEVIAQIEHILSNSKSPIVREMAARDLAEKDALETIYNEYLKYGETYYDETNTEQARLNIAKTVSNYYTSAISYSFRFEINEDNNASGGAEFRLPFTNGLAKFSGGASLDTNRFGKREFTMSENFIDLHELQCGYSDGKNIFLPDGEKYQPLRKNRIYPLTGSVGMNEIMGTFLRLGVLGKGKGNFTDSITFSTTKSGNLGASVELNPGPMKSTRLANAALGTSASRNDIHEVIITIAFPKEAKFKTALEEKLAAKTASQKLAAKTALEKVAEGARFEAAVTQCIQKAEAREKSFNVLRNIPPEVYCFDFAKDILTL